MARTHGKGNWRGKQEISLQLSALGTVQSVFQGTLMHLQEEFSSNFSILHIWWLQTVISSSSWMSQAPSASPFTSLWKPEACLGLPWWPSARLTRTLLKSFLHCELQCWTQYPRCDLKWQPEGKNHFPQPNGYTLANTAQHANSPLCCKGTLQSSTCPQPEAQGLFCKADF